MIIIKALFLKKIFSPWFVCTLHNKKVVKGGNETLAIIFLNRPWEMSLPSMTSQEEHFWNGLFSSAHFPESGKSQTKKG